MDEYLNKIIQGDVLEVLKTLPDESVDCIITSPPYYGLRDYGTAKWEGGNENCDHKIPDNEKDPKYPQGNSHNIRFNRDECYKCGAKRLDKQVGLEKTLNEYLDKMLTITGELKRVLKKTGTLWWNQGDSYSTSHASGTTDAEKGWKSSGNDLNPRQAFHGRANGGNIPTKSLMLQAHRLAIRMIDEQQWILRNTIIWHKPNCMPSSVKDRFTVDYEPVFFFSKSKKYWFEQQLEPNTFFDNRASGMERNAKQYRDKVKGKYMGKENYGGGGNSFKGHSGYTKADGTSLYNPLGRNKRSVWKIPTQPFHEAHFAVFPEALIETPIKAGCPKGGIVLDPFMGAGTTAKVARSLGRNYIGIELNPEYIKIAEKRLAQNILL